VTGAEVVGSVSVFLALVLGASVVTKLRAVSRGEIAGLLVLIPGPRHLRRYLLAGLLVLETVVTVGLLLALPFGPLSATVLFAAYTVFISTVPEGEPCYCFGGSFELGERRVSRVIRNIVLLLLGLGATVGSSSYGNDTASPIAVGAALVSLLLVFSVEALVRASQDLSAYQREVEVGLGDVVERGESC
jgi:hypothetical protein